MKSSESCYLHLDGEIPTDLPNGAFISLKRNTPLKIHSLGFQPAKSIPEIPRWFLKKYGSSPFTVLEPFAGSGTTLIESIIYGASVYWLDYQPLSRLICQVKTTKFDWIELKEKALQILQKAKKKYAPQTIKFKNKDFWFQKPVQEALEILREEILTVAATIQPPLWLAFSLTVRKASDMNDGMILAAKRSHVEAIPKRSREDVFKYFYNYVEKTIAAIGEWQNLIKNKITSQELTAKSATKINESFVCDAVITSPPYINAIDYVWASKFELHWLGMVKDDKDRLNLYEQEIGTERIPKQEWQELGSTGNKKLDELIEDIYTGKKYQASQGQNQLRARVVFKYFLDMKQHFASSFSRLKPGGYYCFAIGDVSKICGVDIPVASLLSELATEIGFCQKFHFHLLLKNRRLNIPRNVNWASIIKHDTVVVLEKK
ncbi:MAG: hypothetical protein DSM107014_05630 [Gomphosphaeria aponina SAG 52.96 = DSM 107014]|uniref:site-specific DNA-methyltransferase (cytosine-N(4)-specific) n=1 Tax=Gomphosphaeria aponina SAG 52.96 = DSM 107014 TaxID=1521640 RepID=A0A941GPW2_9CHRO|nr:hypothetical protein [Gomphosphaeria aponina SAG 52.96 = DSM 107014]